jgi:branched-chain amino acid transport system ATP-binding protein
VTALLELDRVAAAYGAAQVLFDVSLAVDAGEVAVLLGRNGAGKSTTLKCVIGLVRPAAGRILFEGRDIAGLEPWRIARLGIGYVPEERRIFGDLTVEENLEVGRRPDTGPKVWTPERLFALFPNLAALRRRRAAHISGGEQQMLAIARTLVADPQLLLLDEPSEGLAPVIVEQLAAALLEMKRQGLTVLLSEQNLHFAAAVGDRAHVIESGHIRHSDEMRRLLRDRGVLERYLSIEGVP